VTSADSHPVAGAFQFRVGEGGGPSSLTAIQTRLTEDRWRYPVLVARALQYTAMIVAAGATLLLACVGVPGAALKASRCVVIAAASFGAVATLSLFLLLGAQLTGADWATLLTSETVTSVLGSSNSISGAMALAGLAILLVTGRRIGIEGSMGWQIFAVFAAVVSSLSFAGSGHIATADPRWFATSLVAVHGLAATFWAGSIIPLFLSVRLAPPNEAMQTLQRFSRLALPAVIGLLTAGVIMAWIQLQDLAGFWTAYGVRLALKIALVAALLAIAVLNRVRLTPRLARGEGEARTSLLYTLGADIGIFVAVIAVTASLNMDPPPRALIAQSESRQPIATYELEGPGQEIDFDLAAKSYTLKVHLTAGKHGTLSGKLILRDRNGTVVPPLEARFHLSEAVRGIEPLVWQARPDATDGTLTLQDVKIPFAGDWDVRVDVLIDDFTKISFRGRQTLSPVLHRRNSTGHWNGQVFVLQGQEWKAAAAPIISTAYRPPLLKRLTIRRSDA